MFSSRASEDYRQDPQGSGMTTSLQPKELPWRTTSWWLMELKIRDSSPQILRAEAANDLSEKHFVHHATRVPSACWACIICQLAGDYDHWTKATTLQERLSSWSVRSKFVWLIVASQRQSWGFVTTGLRPSRLGPVACRDETYADWSNYKEYICPARKRQKA